MQQCSHCGTNLNGKKHVKCEHGNRFCCLGCRSVYELLDTGKKDDFKKEPFDIWKNFKQFFASFASAILRK